MTSTKVRCLFMATVMVSTTVCAAMPELSYQGKKTSPWQIPWPDNQLQTITATRWKQVTTAPTVLEGPAFDRAGNLFFTDVFHGEIIRADKNRQLKTIFSSKEIEPCAIAIHKNGRIYIAGVYTNGDGGTIFSLKPDGTDPQTVFSADKGYLPNDMVFDKKGGIYFTDARGNSGNPQGGVYYISPDQSAITPVLQHLSGGNGIALSPDGKTLWVIEFSAGVLHRLNMEDATHIQPFGETVAYRFSSPAPDSMKVDNDGNLYVALHGQGRVIVLNRNAIPVGQITIPGRDSGEFLRTSNMAIRPGTREVYILSASEPERNKGAAIFTARGFARGLPLYSEQ